jgi:hypothetical protein
LHRVSWLCFLGSCGLALQSSRIAKCRNVIKHRRRVLGSRGGRPQLTLRHGATRRNCFDSACAVCIQYLWIHTRILRTVWSSQLLWFLQ